MAEQKRRRLHFHAFMQEVHARMNRTSKDQREGDRGASTLDNVATGILKETRLLCLDEVEGIVSSSVQ
jgi:cell division protein ZapE